MRFLILLIMAFLGYSLTQQLPESSSITNGQDQHPNNGSSLDSGKEHQVHVAQKPVSDEEAVSDEPPRKHIETGQQQEIVPESSEPASGTDSKKIRSSVSVASNPIPRLIDHLQESLKTIRRMPAYTATLEQQVEIRGQLRNPDWIDLKLRRVPFSVYMKWKSNQQEVLYVAGQNNGRLLAHSTRGFAALRRVWRLTPDSPRAMKDCRYPITEIGIENLTKITLSFYEKGAQHQNECVCVETHELADGRPAVVYELTFPNDQVSPDYSSSKLIFDNESQLLVGLENYKWDADGQPGTLLESYKYHNVALAPELSSEDFSEQNPEYHFVK